MLSSGCDLSHTLGRRCAPELVLLFDSKGQKHESDPECFASYMNALIRMDANPPFAPEPIGSRVRDAFGNSKQNRSSDHRDQSPMNQAMRREGPRPVELTNRCVSVLGLGHERALQRVIRQGVARQKQE